MPSRRKSGIRLTDEETATIREKLIEGHSYHQVAEIVERSVSTIFRVANELKAEDPVFRDCRQQRRLSEPEVQEWYKMKGVNKLYAPYVTKVSEQRKSSKKTQKVNDASLCLI
ncbi:hypothetical protein CRE_20514 [Caenorhabditis remanei]|uniref:Uncharacterized protein n=1 Tax=Caenorhabditis remanei TaxID=31234 RepID=E3N896_CAERE|nr:hypothetical protein CRE_20514 [Caenorhabditis remanei]